MAGAVGCGFACSASDSAHFLVYTYLDNEHRTAHFFLWPPTPYAMSRQNVQRVESTLPSPLMGFAGRAVKAQSRRFYRLCHCRQN